jgi:Fe-S-cluster-containing dehydrogenase component
VTRRVTVSTRVEKSCRFGMAVDLDLCTGCGACMLACSVENNVATCPPQAGVRKGVTWIRVYRIEHESKGETDVAFVPMLCQHCGHHPPCQQVCPQNAVGVDEKSGIVFQMPQRCLGCRYCMAACPYHARYFNWWTPSWPPELERCLNPDVAPRMRGVVEKCNFCHGRLHEAQARAAAEGRRELRSEEYQPACVEACPVKAIIFGDLNDPSSEIAKAVRGPRAFRLLERLGTDPKVYYLSSRSWVHQIDHQFASADEEVTEHV